MPRAGQSVSRGARDSQGLKRQLVCARFGVGVRRYDAVMPGRGRAPKEVRSRERDNLVFEVVEDRGLVFGPELPDPLVCFPDGEPWHPQTVALWESLRRHPLMEHESDLGWQFLVDTALMHHTMWQKGRWEFASEVRLRLAKYGATPEDRMRLKLKVQTPRDAPAEVESKGDAGSVTSIASRRARLTS